MLTGKVNPSGKLAESWAKAYSDTPARDNFAGDGRTVQYREGLYVGYRYHQTAGVAPAYPFGFGLSYKMCIRDREYTLMIRQPDFISGELVRQAQEQVQRKKPNPLLGKITFGAMQDGLCVEILHIGSYDDEPASFAKMAQFAAAHGLRRTGDYHREIYLSNANRVEPCRRKTILRCPVEPVSPGSMEK